MLDSLLSRYRRFKGQSYCRNVFPFTLASSTVVSFFLTDSYRAFFLTIIVFILIDIILSIAAWLYYPSDL